MADGWAKPSKDELDIALSSINEAAKRNDVVITSNIVEFIREIADVNAQLEANFRQLCTACHLPNNWQAIWQRLEELGIQDEFKFGGSDES